jgi:hypothetical protein
MADVYGAAGQNRFSIPNQVGFFSVEVNKKSGVSQLYLQGAAATQQSVGTYNPSTKKFTPDPNSNLTQQQITRISSPEGIKAITDSSLKAATKGISDGGTNPQIAQTEANKLLSPNRANTSGGTGDNSQSTSLPETNQALGGTKTSGFGNFIYPEDLGQTKQDIIKFTMLEYQPSGLGPVGQQGGQNTLQFGGARGKDRKIAGTVVLPIPSGISDTNSLDWGSNSMNALEAALAAASFEAITEGIGKGISSLGLSAQNAAGDETTKKAVGSAFAAAAVGTNQAALLSRAEGVVLNPNMELLFNGPQLRPFTFTFKMSARNASESKQIINILNFFKRGMSAIKTPSNLFLKSPNTFKIQYIHRPSGANTDHPYIGRIKECALQSLTVNYTPEGQYATFTDGVLVSYEMNMQFSELEPVFNNDYDGLDGTIGY